MANEDIQKFYGGVIGEITDELRGKPQGYVKTMEVGKELFPFSLLPRIEILVLDPEDMTISFRRLSATDSPNSRKGSWRVGTPVDVAICVIKWTNLMRECYRRNATMHAA